MKALTELIDLKLETSLYDKKITYFIQYLSSIIFITLSFFLLNNKAYFLLFLSEGLGQLFLARENQNSYGAKNNLIKYFKYNRLGFFAGLCFLITICARFSFLDHFLAYSIIFSFFFILIFLLQKLRHDIWMGFLIIASSSILTFSFFLSGNLKLMFGHLLYTLLLVLSPYFFKPKISEGLNILIWIYLFILIS